MKKEKKNHIINWIALILFVIVMVASVVDIMRKHNIIEKIVANQKDVISQNNYSYHVESYNKNNESETTKSSMSFYKKDKISMQILKNNDNTFKFKTLSTTCNEFKVSGSIAYDKNKSSIYISHITYCGGDDKTIYKKIECNLYERNDSTSTKISSCKSNKKEITLEEYLKDVELNIDNYTKTCKYYNNESFYLEINAIDKNDKTITYKIPLELKNNCSE